jgi:hypothetical protein
VNLHSCFIHNCQDPLFQVVTIWGWYLEARLRQGQTLCLWVSKPMAHRESVPELAVTVIDFKFLSVLFPPSHDHSHPDSIFTPLNYYDLPEFCLAFAVLKITLLSSLTTVATRIEYRLQLWPSDRKDQCLARFSLTACHSQSPRTPLGAVPPWCQGQAQQQLGELIRCQ